MSQIILGQTWKALAPPPWCTRVRVTACCTRALGSLKSLALDAECKELLVETEGLHKRSSRYYEEFLHVKVLSSNSLAPFTEQSKKQNHQPINKQTSVDSFKEQCRPALLLPSSIFYSEIENTHDFLSFLAQYYLTAWEAQ